MLGDALIQLKSFLIGFHAESFLAILASLVDIFILFFIVHSLSPYCFPRLLPTWW